MIPVLVAVFILSGAAGLIYESIWSRYLGLFVGHSAYAQIIVLVIFLGGMSLGAHLAGRFSSRLSSPLLWYAGAELFAAVFGFAFHETFVTATAWAYQSVFPSLGGMSLTVAKWSIASLLILPQSIILGATFPLMSAGVIRMARAPERAGQLLGLLYFANSVGAAAGVLIAGFWFIEEFGLPGTLLMAAMANGVAAAIVGVLARMQERREWMEAGAAEPAPVFQPPAMLTAQDAAVRRALLAVSFGTAVASFVYEIAWIRMLSLVLGSATHSFELMLSAFILGLALGALWVRSRADTIRDPVRFLGIVQWIMGGLAVATLPLYIASFGWMSTIIQALERNETGYQIFGFVRYMVALIIMLPATFCAGMTLPLITRVLMRTGGERAIGTVYAVNTLGSIAGVILAGLILMPLLGLKLLLVFGAAIDIALGIWLVARRPGARAVEEAAPQTPASPVTKSRWRFAAEPSLLLPVVATVVGIFAVTSIARFELVRLTSGVYRHGLVERGTLYSFPFYRDGRTATVSVRRGGDGFVTLATNGKPDASMERPWMDASDTSTGRQLTRDIATQLLLPILTLAHAPSARNAAVIGHGSGMSSHVLLGSPHVREVVTVEIEPEMINASRVFRPANRRVFEDKRSTFVTDDAKAYFASSGRKFDLILSEPSNPWVSGVSGLFTVEFYERVSRQLAPRGVFGQWLHLYELSDGLVNSVLTAIDTVFPAYEVFYTSNADILVVAANEPLSNPQWTVAQYPGIAQDLRKVIPFTAESFESLRLAGRETLHPMFMGPGAPNSDFYPILDLFAERMRFMHESAEGYIGLKDQRFDVVAALSGRKTDFGRSGLSPTPEIDRSVALALGARIRAVRTLPPSVSALIPRDDELRHALYRLDQLDRMTAVTRAPADWHTWMTSVVTADADVHGGTAGVVDSAFFRRVRQFAERTGAPLEVRAAIDFLEGIGAWNWPKTAVASQALLASPDSVEWIPDVLLRNGAAVSYVMMRDTTGAKKVLQTFAKRTAEDRFTERLIASTLVYRDSTLRARMGSQ